MREQEIRGRPRAVADEIRRLAASGDLDRNWQPKVRYRDGLIAMTVRVVDRDAPVRRRRHTRMIVAGIVGGTAALAGLGYVVYLATAALVDHLLPILGGLVVLVLLGWVGAGQAGACRGIHCPGCKCHR